MWGRNQDIIRVYRSSSAFGVRRGEAVQRTAMDLIDCPFIKRQRSERPVKSDRRRVPVQHHPFHLEVAPLTGLPGQGPQKRLADAATPMFGLHVKILEEKPGLALKRRKCGEGQGEPHWLAVNLRHDRLGAGGRAEEVPAEVVGSAFDRVLQFLIDGQLVNQVRDRGRVVGSRRPDRQRGFGKPISSSIAGRGAFRVVAFHGFALLSFWIACSLKLRVGENQRGECPRSGDERKAPRYRRGGGYPGPAPRGLRGLRRSRWNA